MTFTWQPIVIVGAPRSGTNMLRNVLTSFPGIATWPCDEINYIWRHKNTSYPTDEFTAGMATEYVQRFVRGKFSALEKKTNPTHIIEKTCANSLRVAFVNRVLPEAYFVHLIRDGRDAAVSAAKRWVAGVNWGYLFRKARYVPISDSPRYAWRYLNSRFYRLVSRDRRLSIWGPVFKEMASAFQELPLLDACALQWQRCVELSTNQLSCLPRQRVCKINYEKFVETVLSFTGIQATPTEIAAAVNQVTRKNVGTAASELSNRDFGHLTDFLQPTLDEHGYQDSRLSAGRALVLPLERARRPLRDLEGIRRRAG